MITDNLKYRPAVRVGKDLTNFYIGGYTDIVVFDEPKDRRQYWLNFGTTYIFKDLTAEIGIGKFGEEIFREFEKVQRHPKPKIKQQTAKISASQTMFDPEFIPENQYVLPFEEHLYISSNRLKKWSSLDFPGWDRQEDGSLLEIQWRFGDGSPSSIDRERYKERCRETCEGLYCVKRNKAFFQKWDDYRNMMLFK